MSNTTVSTVTETSTTISPLDLFISFIQIPSITTQFFLWGYLITFVLGFTGNILSLLTFFRPTLRNISTGCLFILLAVSDTLYLLVAVIDFVEFGLQIRLYHRVDYDALCRFRVFTICVAQLFSAWLLVIIVTDRWIRTKFPFKSNSLCTPKKAFLVAAILLILVVGLNSHMLLLFFGMLLPGIPLLACAANGINAQYTTFYFLEWTIIQIVTTSFAPAVLMTIMAVNMFFKIRAQKRAVVHQPQSVNVDRSAGQYKRAQNQMFILMVTSICIFLVTTFPLTIGHVVSSYTITDLSGIRSLLINITILNWIQSLNCAVNFYLYCLTSTLFRKEFIQLVGINHGQSEHSLTASKRTRTVHVVQPQLI